MKSYFSRFLHHTLSYSGLPRISRSNKVANFFHLDTPVKPECDTMGTDALLKFENDRVCAGRSMVEMLGVLAIIGVLSVGAIAGYSKAMFKYKLNKQAESFNMLLNTAIQLQPDLLRTVNQGSRISSEFFYKANLLPDGMTFKNNRIYDIFNSELHFMFYHSPKNNQISEYTEYFLEYKMERSGTSATSRSIEICRNMLNAAKENAGDLPFIQLRSGKDETSANFDTKFIYGDKECTGKRTCLRNMGVKTMDDFCSSCNSENWCTILYYIYFDNPY